MDDMAKLAVLPKLEKLNLSWSNQVKMEQLSKLICTSRTLKYLKLQKNKYITDELFTYGTITTPLEYLSLEKCLALTDLTLNTIATHMFRSLKVLNLCHCVSMSAACVVETVKRLPGLVLLDVSGLYELNESHLFEIIQAYDGKPWQVCVRCFSSHINYKKLYDTFLCKFEVRTDVSDFFDVYYKNLKIQLKIQSKFRNFDNSVTW
jgi:hypothetical protein